VAPGFAEEEEITLKARASLGSQFTRFAALKRDDSSSLHKAVQYIHVHLSVSDPLGIYLQYFELGWDL
jgi:hypothetical protein